MSTKRNINKNSQLSAISRLFSANIVREMSKNGYSPMFARLAKEADLVSRSNLSAPVSDIFENAFSILRKKDNRHEYVYKAALTHKILLGTHSLKSAAMINEFRVGDCKADTVILNGTGSVYEIKSERDTLSRLVKQTSAYRKVFATVNVITGENHLTSVIDATPEDVGVLLLSDRFQISTVRNPIDRPERTNSSAMFDSIQILEAKLILKHLKVDIPDVPNTKMHGALKSIFEELDPILTHACMVNTLRQTRSLVPLSSLTGILPKSILPAVFSTKMRKNDYANLVKAVETPLHMAIEWN